MKRCHQASRPSKASQDKADRSKRTKPVAQRGFVAFSFFDLRPWLCLSRAVGKTGFQLVMTLPQLFFLFVARVSGVTPLAGPVAKKKKL